MKVWNVRKETVCLLLEALEDFGVCRADVRDHMDWLPDGSAVYYAQGAAEGMALRTVERWVTAGRNA